MFQKIIDKTPEQLVRGEIEIWRAAKFFSAAAMVVLFVACVFYLFTADEVSAGFVVFLPTMSFVSGLSALIFEGKQHGREYDYQKIFGTQGNAKMN